MKRNAQDLQFVIDNLIAQEVAVALLINAWLKLSPEVAAQFISSLDHVLGGTSIPTKGARANLEKLRAEALKNLPSAAATH